MGFRPGTQVFPGGRVLSLASARASDSGSYSCVAVSAVGEDRQDVVLSVHGESRSGCCLGPAGAQRGGAGGVPPGSPSRVGEGWLGTGGAGLRPWLPSWGLELEVKCSPIADGGAGSGGEWPT